MKSYKADFKPRVQYYNHKEKYANVPIRKMDARSSGRRSCHTFGFTLFV